MITQFVVGCSRTINIGNFESVRVEASVTTSVDEDSVKNLSEMEERAQDKLRTLLEETYKHQYSDRKKIA
jgi:hypothetical protein